MPKRKESTFASDRKQIHIVDLKVVDLLATGDELEFVYKGVRFVATVTVHGYIGTPRHAQHTLASFTDATTSYYHMPTNFTNDCVSVYWCEHADAHARNECHTNPSGYERVKHVKTARSLNELRDAYMVRYVTPKKAAAAAAAAAAGVDAATAASSLSSLPVAEKVRLPDDVADAIVSRVPSRQAAKRRRLDAERAAADAAPRRRPTPANWREVSRRRTFDDDGDNDDYDGDDDDNDDDDDTTAAAIAESDEVPADAADVGADVAQMLADGAITIATLRSSNRLRGYKAIAEALQDKLVRQSKVMHALMGFTEKFAHSSQGDETDAARDAVRLLSAAIDASAAAIEAHDDVSTPSERVLPQYPAATAASSAQLPHLESDTARSSSSSSSSSHDIVQFITQFQSVDLDSLLEQSLAGTYK